MSGRERGATLAKRALLICAPALAALSGPAALALETAGAPFWTSLVACLGGAAAAGFSLRGAARERARTRALLRRLAPFAEPFDPARPRDAHQRIARGVEATHRRLAEIVGDPVRHDDDDPLTGLPGRLAIMRRGRGEITRARRKEAALALALVAIDPASTEAAALPAARRMLEDMLLRGLRAYDAVGRWDAETFVAVLPEAEVEQAAGAVARLREACEAAFAEMGSTSRLIAGVAVLHPDDASVADIGRRAEAALDRARAGAAPGIEAAPGPRVAPARLSLVRTPGAS